MFLYVCVSLDYTRWDSRSFCFFFCRIFSIVFGIYWCLIKICFYVSVYVYIYVCLCFYDVCVFAYVWIGVNEDVVCFLCKYVNRDTYIWAGLCMKNVCEWAGEFIWLRVMNFIYRGVYVYVFVVCAYVCMSKGVVLCV